MHYIDMMENPILKNKYMSPRLSTLLQKLTIKWIVAIAIITGLFVGIAIGEQAGWPFLKAPLEKKLSSLMQRKVTFNSNENKDLTHVNGNRFRVNFLGGLSFKADKLNIAAPFWSTKPHFVDANEIVLKLRYIDIWRAYQGEPIRIKSLQAAKLDGFIERQADGRSSWQFSDKPTDPNKPLKPPVFDELLVTNGLLHVNDIPLKSTIEAKLALVNEPAKGDVSIAKNTVLTANASGLYKAFPLKIELVSTGTQLSSANQSDKLPAAITFDATIGRAHLKFKGSTKDMMRPTNFVGSYNLSGPSLAAVGDLVGVTLPTTAKFSTNGTVEKQDAVWSTRIKQMAVGASVLNGRFSYDKSLATPLLKGQLAGKLVITDLAPVLGANADAKKSGKVLPTRPFDLASLHKMNADVMIDMQYLDLKTSFLEPLKPLKTHLKLNNAVLTLNNIQASTAGGHLTGDIALDGHGSKALWDANLAWNDVELARWVKQKRADGSPPYISGKLNGKALLKGQGRSTAEILASLDGSIRSQLHEGAVSHLGVELAGLDIAQSIGVWFKGDDALPVQCAVVDLQAKNGLFTPRTMVVDTADTTVWVEGSLSLATEKLNLRAMALPKDFSPLTLRVPLNITGSFSAPNVSLEKKPIGLKLAAAALLAIVNPLAAAIPLLDSGDTKEAKQRAAGCIDAMRSLTKNQAKR